MCGCGSDGKCHNCNEDDFIGYINGSSIKKSPEPFGTNGMSCSNDTIVIYSWIY